MPDRSLQEPVTSSARPAHQSGNSTLSIAAIALSTLALIGTGLTLYQLSALRQEIAGLKSSIGTLKSRSEQTVVTPASGTAVVTVTPVPIASPVAQASPTTTPTQTQTPTPQAAPAIQPGQFVQPAFRDKGEVELLKVNRVSGERDVINVQLRVRLFQPEETIGTDSITMGGITAHNPSTSETYEAVLGKSSAAVSLFSMRVNNQTSADAYVWLRVPEGVNTVNISVPNTEEFLNVPISPK